ncbi:unnamed protein product [Rotaria socialis]|uniref:EF-hand domain-containing protein n=1 Tax=Rotaria socialis TaxID=392032 RepID=A0A817SN90_9BILA|nr:unnamed protein product [Rotaria socialis]CAF3454577.1 unnamed protein product [Rotaria socialis]CAF3656916.1 unnamed protein product [Rotaria socialis]CAF3670965.1 unnamed protein product [Rotaria socialis]CAF3745669.1 unnamed protein product [Rotaria socialis]
MQNNNDEYYKQIFHSNVYLNYDNHSIIKINLTNRFRLYIFCFLILTSASTALPIPPVNSNQANSLSYIQQPSTTFSIEIFQFKDSSTPSIYPQLDKYNVYRHIPIASYSNNAVIQVYDDKNLNNQPQLRRERYRRAMIDRMFLMFDEDADGQMTKDELYSLSLRLNIFPKMHHFLKQSSIRK